MRRLLLPLILLLLPILAHASDKVCAPPSLIKVVTISEPPDLPIDHFVRKPKTIYRIGNRFGRIEEMPNPKTGIHLLIVVSEPDLWMVNRLQKQGKYLVDPGPTFNFRARLFGESPIASDFIRNLEIGCEIKWLKEAGGILVKVIDPLLGEVNKIEYVEGPERIILFVREDIPLQVKLFGAIGLIASMKYLSFETGLERNPELFTKPEGINFDSE